jgi:hypothetical protein
MFTAMALLAMFWKSIRYLQIIRKIADHQPLFKSQAAQRTSFANRSFIIIISMAVIGIAFVATGNVLFKESTLIGIIREDGLIEQLTALFFLLCSIFSSYIAIKSNIRSKKIVHAIFAIGFFFCFGEEISWAQRIIGFTTPKALTDVNVQNEFNLHNIGGYLSDHLFIAGVFIYGFILPLLTKTHPFWLKLFDKTGLPIASIGLACGFFIISLLHDWTIYRILPQTIIPIAELRELLSSIGFCLLMIESLKLSTNVSILKS